MKICNICKIKKEPSDFYKNNASKDKLTNKCKSCSKEYQQSNRGKLTQKKYNKSNKKKISSKRYRDKEDVKLAEYIYRRSDKCKKTVRDSLKKYLKTKEGRAKANAREAKRRASKKNATPIWANLEAITQFYIDCPKGYEVDHVVPLQGIIVRGLHVLINLQYLTKSENMSKGNKF